MNLTRVPGQVAWSVSKDGSGMGTWHKHTKWSLCKTSFASGFGDYPSRYIC